MIGEKQGQPDDRDARAGFDVEASNSRDRGPTAHQGRRIRVCEQLVQEALRGLDDVAEGRTKDARAALRLLQRNIA